MTDDFVWTPEDVRIRLEEVAETLHLMPRPRNGTPAGHQSNMPNPQFDYWGLMNSMTKAEKERWAQDNNRVRRRPTSQQIRRLDQALPWFYRFNAKDRTVLFARALGMGYRRIARFDGRSHTWLSIIIERYHADIAKALNAGKLTADPPNYADDPAPDLASGGFTNDDI